MLSRLSQALIAGLVLACSGTSAENIAAQPAPDAPASQPDPVASPPKSEAPDAVPGPPPAALPPPALPAKAAELQFAFVGDVIFGRYRPTGYDPIPEGDFEVFGPMADALKADVLVGNLETPLARELPTNSPIGSRFRFGASLAHAQHLVKAGFTAMSLANNHWYDMRREGVEQTPRLLEELGIVPLGAATTDAAVFRVQTIEHQGWRIGFVALTTRSNAPQREGVPTLPYLATRAIKTTIPPLLEAARDSHDLLIVQIHWGDEYASGPNVVQVKAAHAMVDAGADWVIGHHPHVLQGVERYGGGLIAYSLGNFLFENTSDPPRLTGVLRLKVREGDRCLQQVLFHPAYIKRRPVQHPVPATGYMGRRVKDRLRAVSKRFGAVWTDEGGRSTALTWRLRGRRRPKCALGPKKEGVERPRDTL